MGEGDNRRAAAAAGSLDLKSLNVITPLGRGAKGVVFLARSAEGESFALKAVLRQFIEKSSGSKKKGYSHGPNGHDVNIAVGGDYASISFEEDVLASLDHPLFPRLRGVLQTDQIVGYAIDYCPGRDLNTLRKRQTEKMFSDDIIRFYAAEIVLALEYLHGMGIVYRDLKPENVMIQESGHLMLVDFDLSTKLSIRSPETRRSAEPSPEASPVNNAGRGRKKKKRTRSSLSMFCKSGIIADSDSVHPVEFSSNSARREERASAEKSNSFVGTEEYLAPEVISGNGHDFSVDWWCLGVMMYEMLYGTTPFRGIDRKETYYRILARTPELVGEPTPLRDLIGKLLEKDPKKRICLEEIKGHGFFKNVEWDHVLEISRPPFIPPVEDRKGNIEIDVESFVREIFQGEDNGEKLENKKYSGNKKKGDLVEGLKKPQPENENFLVF